MKRSFLSFAYLAIILFASMAITAPSAKGFPALSNEEIRRILAQRLGSNADRIGIVVGIIDAAGKRIVAQGSFGENDKRRVDGDTLFEIGSTTKVFTSLLLADRVRQGKAALNDPATKYLPPGTKMPERGGRAITLEDLARHRSALPRLPTNLDASANPLNPYASYTVKQLYEFLSGYSLPRDIGAEFEYSNLGAGLLGHVLSLSAGKDYETLVRSRICEPLGMRDTAIALSSNLKLRLAQGHDGNFKPTSNWELPTLAGAGALRSTASDLLSFLGAQLGYAKTNLASAIDLTRTRRMPAGSGMEIGLGWLMRPKKDSEIIWHNGGTGGYRSFFGYDPKARVGVVVLTNVFTPAGVDDIGFHLLDPESPVLPPDSPLVRPPREHKEISLGPEVLDIYIGKYQFMPSVFMTIARQGNQLSAQLTGQGPADIFPETQTDFFYKVVDAQILFRTDNKGRAEALILRQMGRDQLARKVEESSSDVQEWFGHKEAKVDPAILDRYVGRYQMPAAGIIFSVTREGNQILTQQTGQQKIEVFPESERVFFPKIFDAQITFEIDGAGPATAIILRQNGREIRGTRIAD